MAEVLILADPHLLTITWVTNALKATTVLKDHTKPLSVHQALIILKKEKSRKNNVFCANLALSRMNGARKAVKCAVSTLIRQKEPLFATVLERTELIQLETPRAAARVASTISTNQISRRALSVTSQIVSHSFTKIVKLTEEAQDSPMAHVSLLMNVKMLAMVSLALARRFLVFAHVQTRLTLMKSVTKTAVRVPQSSFITAHFQSN